MLTKITIEATLKAELDDHLGFAKHEFSEANNNQTVPAARCFKRSLASFNRIRFVIDWITLSFTSQKTPAIVQNENPKMTMDLIISNPASDGSGLAVKSHDQYYSQYRSALFSM